VACIRRCGGETAAVQQRNPAYVAVLIAIAVIVIGLFVWQPWNSNGALWGK